MTHPGERDAVCATWFCNKCGKVGEAATRADAEKQHMIRSPKCGYLPGWNWKPAATPPTASAPPREEAPETIRCANCGRECEPINDSDAPVTLCVDCAPAAVPPPDPAGAARAEAEADRAARIAAIVDMLPEDSTLTKTEVLASLRARLAESEKEVAWYVEQVKCVRDCPCMASTACDEMDILADRARRTAIRRAALTKERTPS